MPHHQEELALRLSAARCINHWLPFSVYKQQPLAFLAHMRPSTQQQLHLPRTTVHRVSLPELP